MKVQINTPSSVNIYSFKIMMHSLFLKTNIFTQDYDEIKMPMFTIKFVDFPALMIKGNKQLRQEDFQINKQELQERLREKRLERLDSKEKNILEGVALPDSKFEQSIPTRKQLSSKEEKRQKNAKKYLKKISKENTQEDTPLFKIYEKDELKMEKSQVQVENINPFGKGKAASFKLDQKIMKSYLTEYALVIEFQDDFLPKKIGQSLLQLSHYLQDIQLEYNEKYENFRRNTFKLQDMNKQTIGWYDMSLSIVKRLPFSMISQINNIDSLQQPIKPQIESKLKEVDQINENKVTSPPVQVKQPPTKQKIIEEESYQMDEFDSLSQVQQSHSQGPTPQKSIDQKFDKTNEFMSESINQDFDSQVQSASVSVPNLKVAKKKKQFQSSIASLQESVDEYADDFEEDVGQSRNHKLSQSKINEDDKISEYTQEFESASMSMSQNI